MNRRNFLRSVITIVAGIAGVKVAPSVVAIARKPLTAEELHKLTVPVLRNFYPRLLVKDLVNVMPIDKPECIQKFLRPYSSAKLLSVDEFPTGDWACEACLKEDPTLRHGGHRGYHTDKVCCKCGYEQDGFGYYPLKTTELRPS